MDDEINVNVWYFGVFAYQYYPDIWTTPVQ